MSETNFQTRVEFRIEAMKSMMDSCYAYHSLSKEERYLQKYKSELGVYIFNKIYDEYAEYLKSKYIVVNSVHTDSEGVTYNSLKERI